MQEKRARLPEINQPSFGGFFENVQCPGDDQPPGYRLSAPFPLVNQERIGFDHHSQRNRLVLTRAKLQRWVGMEYTANLNPIRQNINQTDEQQV